jgi:hypothetical protein
MSDNYTKVVEDFAFARIDVREARRELPQFREYTDTEIVAKLRLSWSARLAKREESTCEVSSKSLEGSTG